jgi:hypothetical protein
MGNTFTTTKMSIYACPKKILAQGPTYAQWHLAMHVHIQQDEQNT